MEILDAPGLPRGQEPMLEGAQRLREGERVVAKLRQAPEGGRPARMTVASIIGHETDPATDAETLIEEFRLRHEYPEEGIAQAEAAAAPVEGAPCPKGREDLRELWCCTIDPATAKDHDDAISIEPAPNGTGWIIGVHIADVGHYVTPGSPCDLEAKERGNSVYLLSRVVHMLPEALAADVCSLRPDVDRYAVSCFL
ncbi:MAG: RNB domain-containing ribonuclease, partial [Planctomycetota bacterium]